MLDKLLWNKSSLLLKNILLNTQTLQLFMMNIKTKPIYKSYKNAKQEAWVERLRGLLKEGVERKRLKWGLQNLLD